MKRLIICLLALPLLLSAASVDNLLMNQDDHLRIIVNNRVLANVNGKPITVIDVMKRMDIIFLKQFAEYTHSVSARHQFYLANWKRTLSELVDKELILADAKESKMEVANGDVRQEMEELFGPNIIMNLDKIGLPMDEATKIVSGDIAIRRMMYIKVTAKAMGKITPQAVRAGYDRWSKENTKPTSVTYRMITIRDPNPVNGEKTAKLINEKLKSGSFDQDTLKALLAPHKEFLSLSEEFTHNEKEIAPQNREILLNLQAGATSDPVQQKSRADNIAVWRLFVVMNKEIGGAPSYKEAEPRIKEILLDQAIGDEQKNYLTRLRKHFAVKESQIKEMIPEEFTPFSLK